MNKEQIGFMISLFEKINTLRSKGYDGEKTIIEIKESANGKPYWVINIKFRYGNSNYEDCIIFREGDEFNYTEILEELDVIIDKAEVIAK